MFSLPFFQQPRLSGSKGPSLRGPRVPTWPESPREEDTALKHPPHGANDSSGIQAVLHSEKPMLMLAFQGVGRPSP